MEKQYSRIVNSRIAFDDLQLFCDLAETLSFSRTAEQRGVSTAHVTKRIRSLETVLGCRLFHRSTRQVSITDQGVRVRDAGRQILDSMSELRDDLAAKQNEPRGVLRVSTSFGFGRCVVAESLSEFSRKYPEIEVRLDVYDELVDLAQNRIDLDIRVGDVISPNYIAKRLARNYRVLCASPDYLRLHGEPRNLKELAHHNCLIIKERDHPVGLWRLTRRGRHYTVKVRGALVTNNGEIALSWALAGHGIILRSIWDAGRFLQRGDLVNVLPEYTQEANIWAVYPERLSASARIKLCVRHMEAFFQRWEATTR